ncbi:PP2C family protein-serine/threonine phosphatase, partial [Serratia sp. Ag1]|uniref:PP2C family protein-serine/threonine phosphatase n=2 Tax=Serratia TaxID=613 RepID=UPI0005011EAA
IDTTNGQGTLCQAGHPTPFVIGSGGELQAVGQGGMPVGLFPDAEYQDSHFTLGVGDRLYLYSDGITECENHQQELYGEERLQQLLCEYRKLPKNQLFQRVEKALSAWHSGETDALQEQDKKPSRPFADDISLMAIERIT